VSQPLSPARRSGWSSLRSRPPLRVAVLSFWHVHAGDYSRSTVEHPDTELVAIWDDDPDRGRAAAEKFDTSYTDDLDALLARDDLDAVVITTPTADHRDVMVKAAEAGLHIFTEKLLAPTVAECEEIIAAADAHQSKLIVSLPRLYHGYTQAISDVIAGGGLGQLTYARVRLSHDGAVDGWLPERFFEPAPAIGGALTDLGCHPVYLTQLFLGAEPESVSATYRSVTHRALEDQAVVTLGYPDQAIGVIEAGFVSRNPFTIELNGTAGSLRYTDADRTLSVHGAAFGEGWQQLDVPADSQDAYGQWVEHIAHDTRADDNLARAVELTRLVVAANEAAAPSRAISYPPA
jgi:1,5-anhydro-D-fructose reductase (1,5-anhydro-D-mannitol-forming)